MQDDRPRHGNGRHGGGDETRNNLPPQGGRPGPGMDSGFFASHGFDEELDSSAFENTALNNLDPVREAQLFAEFEQDYRAGGHDPGPDRGRTRYHSAYRSPDSRPGAGDSGYQDSGYREPDSGYQEPDSGYREPADHPDDGRPRHGKSRDRHGSGDRAPREDRHSRRAAEGPARIPLFARKTKSAPTRRPAPQPHSRSRSQPRSQSQPRSASQSPFGDLTPYLVPILAGVVIVMVIVVLLLNR